MDLLYINVYEVTSHLIPIESTIQKVQELEEMFADLERSYRGPKIRVIIEDHMARPWPETKPQYE